MPEPKWDRRHLLTLSALGRADIEHLLNLSEELRDIAMRDGEPLNVLRGRIIANLFFEDSTRTRSSFTIAAMRLGGQTVDLVSAGSSLSKGETVVDTARNIEAMGVDAIVVRSQQSGEAAMIAQNVPCPVINAGDGRHEHPTQGLLDILTLRQKLGDLSGRSVAIVGDIANSRVARSNIHGLTTLGANVILVGPPTLVPGSLTEIARGPGTISTSYNLDEVVPTVDAIMMLRVQFERQVKGQITADYRQLYGLTVERARQMKPGALVYHPGPINRGMELDGQVADAPDRSAIMNQVANGVTVRMAVMHTLLAKN